MDGIGDDGADAGVAGGGGECDTRAGASGSAAGAGACLRPGRVRVIGVYRWLGGVSQQHSAAFREKVKVTAERGRASLQVWPQLHIGAVIKHTVKSHLTHITRRMAQGGLEQAIALLAASRGGSVLNTAFIERLNGTMRERLAALTHKCRHAAHLLTALHTGMYLLGCTYNFCWPYQELSRSAPDEETGKRTWVACTPAMANGLTDHVWSLGELMSYRVAPSPWSAPKRRGRKRIRPLPDPTAPKRPRGRPPKVAACSSTS